MRSRRTAPSPWPERDELWLREPEPLPELTESQEIVRRSEERFRRLAENATDLITRFDRRMRHLYVNPAAARAYGLPADAVIGRSHAQLGLPGGLVSLWQRHLSDALASNQPRRMEYPFEGPAGPAFYEAVLVPEVDRAGEVESVLVITRDVTERRRLEDALWASEQRLRERNGELQSVLAEQRRAVERMAALTAAQQALDGHLLLPAEVLDRVLGGGALALGALVGLVVRRAGEREGAELELVGQLGLEPALAEVLLPRRAGEGEPPVGLLASVMAGWSAPGEEGRIWVGSLPHGGAPQESESYPAGGIETLVLVPLRPSHPIGLLGFGMVGVRTLTPEEHGFLRLLGGQVERALAR